jgi:hypothetical protein
MRGGGKVGTAARTGAGMGGGGGGVGGNTDLARLSNPRRRKKTNQENSRIPSALNVWETKI